VHCSDCKACCADEAVTEAVAAPVNEDLNDEEDETPEENALAETAATEKKAAKGAAKQQKVTWLGGSQAGACGEQLYRYRHARLTVMACINKATQVICRQKQPSSLLVSILGILHVKGVMPRHRMVFKCVQSAGLSRLLLWRLLLVI